MAGINGSVGAHLKHNWVAYTLASVLAIFLKIATDDRYTGAEGAAAEAKVARLVAEVDGHRQTLVEIGKTLVGLQSRQVQIAEEHTPFKGSLARIVEKLEAIHVRLAVIEQELAKVSARVGRSDSRPHIYEPR